MDGKTGEAFVFDVCSFYGHNEYDTGNWRAPRHRLSDKAYIRNYTKVFPASEPAEDWDARNLLYSLTFNIGNTIYIPGSQQKQVYATNLAVL
jgi:fructosamine-3-kinase